MVRGVDDPPVATGEVEATCCVGTGEGCLTGCPVGVGWGCKVTGWVMGVEVGDAAIVGVIEIVDVLVIVEVAATGPVLTVSSVFVVLLL